MDCQRCNDWFLKKLGRCHACMVQTALIFLLSFSTWLWIDDKRSVEAIAAAFFATAGGGLFVLHIAIWLFTKGKGLAIKK
ncbi:DUF3624 family protein [Motilimonas cestriensis]|uniref:DUF3624 family protein n=1 Tax=Motilimonas cestriensis TaxID=2742685 RepID=A0ABS8W9P3_9GAMM|nr:DUF3624 family protein [Motilimonas cestriensis]MCE2594975.1 DUF3624 family protein [Motilimonas cestriensis]